MAEPHSLGESGRAARVRQHDEIVPPDADPRGRHRGGAGHEVGEWHRVRLRRCPGAHRDHVSEARQLAPHGADEREEVVLHDHRDDVGVGELVGDLALLVGWVHRARNGARAGDGEEAHDVLGPIRHEEAHAVARSDAEIA